MSEKDRHLGLAKKFSSNAAEDEFANPGVAKSARHEKIRLPFERCRLKRGSRRLPLGLNRYVLHLEPGAL